LKRDGVEARGTIVALAAGAMLVVAKGEAAVVAADLQLADLRFRIDANEERL
jgi:hypothetical protein